MPAVFLSAHSSQLSSSVRIRVKCAEPLLWRHVFACRNAKGFWLLRSANVRRPSIIIMWDVGGYMQSLGVIRQLRRYPVKSMGGEPLEGCTFTLQGIPGDRRYAFVQKASRSSFPWLTARELPELLCYSTFAAKVDPREAEVIVTTPSGERLAVTSDELRQALESHSGRELFLLYDYRGSYDVAPISLISSQTVGRLAEESETKEDHVRFRPNLLVDLETGEAFDDLSWVGRILRIGNAARIAITEVDQRCMIITLDPNTAQPSPSVLRCVVQQHKQCAGVYATVLTPGEVRVGDIVSMEA